MTNYLHYKRQLAVLDENNSEIESWITVRGNHIPIKKGQSKEDAVKEFVKSKFENKEWNLENTKTGEKYYANKKTGYFGKETPSHSKAITKSAIEMGKEEKNLEELMEFGVKEANSAKPESKPESKKTEFESVFGNSSWNAHKDWASYVDNDYRIEVIKENGGYYISKFDIDDYDGSDPEMEEYANTIEEAKQVAEKMIRKSQPLSKEEKITRAQKVRDLMNSSIRFEKEGKKFRITGLYNGGEVELDFEKLTGQSPNQSVEYKVENGVLHINDYYGHWHKKIDFSKLDDNEIADMIIK